MTGKHDAERHEHDERLDRDERHIHDDRDLARDHRTPDEPTAGGRIVSGHGDEVPEQSEGGLIISGHGDEVPNQTAGGLIIEGKGDLVPDGEINPVIPDEMLQEDKHRMEEALDANEPGREAHTDAVRRAEDERAGRGADEVRADRDHVADMDRDRTYDDRDRVADVDRDAELSPEERNQRDFDRTYEGEPEADPGGHDAFRRAGE